MGLTDFEYLIAPSISSGGLSENDVYARPSVLIGDGSIDIDTSLIAGLANDFEIYETFDLSSLVKGDQVAAAMIQVRTPIGIGADFDILYNCIEDAERLRSISPQTTVIHNAARFMGGLSEFLTPLTDSHTAGTSADTFLRMYMDGRDDFEFRFTQIFTVDTSGDASFALFRMRSSVADQGTGTLHYELWSTTGSSGAYVKDALLTTGVSAPLTIEGIPTSEAARFRRIAPVGGPFQEVVPDEVYAVDMVFTPNGDAAADSYLEIGVGTIDGTAPGLGSRDNMLAYGDPLLHGFAAATNFIHADELRSATQVSASDAAASRPLPTVGAGDLVSIGDPTFSPTIEVAGFTQIIRDAIDQTQSGFICLQTAAPDGSDGVVWSSSRSVLPTLTDPDRFGTVLTLRLRDLTLGTQGVESQRNVKVRIAASSSVARELGSQRNVVQGFESQLNISRSIEASRNVSATIGVGDPNG